MQNSPTDGPVARWMPGLKLLRHYGWADFPSDLLSALVVVLVLIPSAIAYADLALCPPVAGLYAALAGMVTFALFTSSRHVITGPDAAIALLVGAGVGSLAGGDPARAVTLATWLALLTGVLLLLGFALKLGAAADFLATPVMLGFMNGAAVVIVISQLGKLFGIPLTEDNSLLRVVEWTRSLGQTHFPTLLIGLSCIAVLAALRYWYPRIPGSVVVFTLAVLVGGFIDFSSNHIAVIGTINPQLPAPLPPEVSMNDVAKLLVTALGLALLIFPEGIVLGRSLAARHRYDIDPDQELFALGAANIATGLFHSFSVGASQTRSLLNAMTGGRTQMVSLLAAVLLVIFLYFFAGWIAGLPVVVIAAILTFTGFTLVDLAAVRQLRKVRPADARLAVFTSVGVVALGVLPGILIGIVLSLLRLLSQLARPHDALLGAVPGSSTYHDVGDDEKAKTIPGLVIYRFYGPLFFANVRYFLDRVEHFIEQEDEPVREIILDVRAIPEIDVTAADALKAWIDAARARGIRIVLAKPHLPFREAAKQLGLAELVADGAYHGQLADAVTDYKRRFGNPSGAVGR